MRVLGIDPGLATIGYGVIDTDGVNHTLHSYGLVTTSSSLAFVYRLDKIYSSILGVIDEFKPDEFAIEELFFSRNKKTALSVSHARGVIMLAAVHRGLNIFEYKPNEVKLAVSGYGASGKSAVIKMLSYILSLDDLSIRDDAADALAIAVCHSNMYRSTFNQM